MIDPKKRLEEINTKTCTKCHEIKNIAKFHKNKNSKDSWNYYCKVCMNKMAKKYYEENLEERRKYRQKNRERINARTKKWRYEHPDNAKNLKKKKPWYGSYHGAVDRCSNPNHIYYKYYGGRGIKCLMKPKDFKFLWFRDKAYLMTKPSIDRKDNDGNYELTNCHFIEQVENTIKRNSKAIRKLIEGK